MKTILTCLILIVSYSVLSQRTTNVDQVDTLNLNEFEYKQIVRYSLEGLTIFVPLNDFLIGIKGFHKTYKNGVKRNEKFNKMVNDNSVFKSENAAYKKQFIFIDSVLQTVKSDSKLMDTLDIDHKIFDKEGLRSPVDFGQLIENGNCAIYDHEGIRQFKIIKQYESDYYENRGLWGGTRYYLMRSKKHFFENTFWIS